MASAKGNQQLVQLLVETGVDMNAQGGYFRIALHAPTMGGYEATTEFLLENHASSNVTDNFRRTPLHLALYQWNETIVSALVQHGADPSIIALFAPRIC